MASLQAAGVVVLRIIVRVQPVSFKENIMPRIRISFAFGLFVFALLAFAVPVSACLCEPVSVSGRVKT
jgi:hypothetical protein